MCLRQMNSMMIKAVRNYILIFLSCIGCSSAVVTPTPTTCNDYLVISGSTPTCFVENNYTLIQTPLNQQVQLQINNHEIAIQGTAIIWSDDNTQKIISVEGTFTIGGNQQTLSINSGQQITVNEDSQLSNITNYNYIDLQNIAFDQLQRIITLIEPTATPILTNTPDVDCPPPENWIDNYIIQAGDSLTSIANRANVPLQELQDANCIDNPNNIQVGQILIVPENSIPATQPSQTFTPSAVFFRADSESISRGNCTVLRWDVQNIRQLTLNNELITTNTNQEVCPDTTTTYTLTVDYYDERQTEHIVTVTVNDT